MKNVKKTCGYLTGFVCLLLFLIIHPCGRAGAGEADLEIGVPALEFRAGHYVNVGNADALNPGKQITLEAWIRPMEDNQAIIWRGHTGTGSGDNSYALMTRHNQIRVRIGGSQAHVGSIRLGRWTHVAVTFDEGSIRIYQDGRLVGTDSRGDSMRRNDQNTVIGIREHDGEVSTAGHSTWVGDIRDVRIWNVARTQEQIASAMHSVLEGDEEGLVGYWRFDEGEGETVRDSSPHGNHGRIEGARWIRADAFSSPPVSVLQERGDEEAVAVLRHIVREVDAPALQANAMAALGEIGDEGVVEDLREALESDHWLLRREAGRALERLGRELPAHVTDWPMWRYDAARSAQAPLMLAEDLHLQWVRELPAPKRAWPQQRDDGSTLQFDVAYTPIAADGRVFVPSMMTDSVTAYDIEDGSELWRFYADGPVRLAPAFWNGRVYLTSDDGHLYCVDAESGELKWKFRGGPTDHRLLGNARLVSFWYARTGPVVMDGTVYFTAGTWPIHGVFVYGIDAESGDMKWVNDTSSLHDRRTMNVGFAPQGYIAANEDEIIVAGGRSGGFRFDRHTGGEIGNVSRGWAVNAVNEPFAGKQSNAMLRSRVRSLNDRINGSVFYKLAAGDRLIVSTEDGRVLCFGPEEIDPVTYEYSPVAPAPAGERWVEVAESLLEGRSDRGGYALVLGAGSGELLRALIDRSDMHIVVVEEDAGTVRGLRDELSEAGDYGHRASVIAAGPAGFSVQPYLFELIVSEDLQAAGIGPEEAQMKVLLEWLRPYSGVAWLGGSGQFSSELAGAAESADVDQVSSMSNTDHLFAERGGPLSGAGEWTHQWHCPGNTLTSGDERVRLPLGLLWFGGPGNHNILPRHARGPRPQVAGGRQVFLGPDNIAARCVYSGRELWERRFERLGGPFDTTAHQAGAVWVGSPFVTLPDAVYLRYDGIVHRLDAGTGETVGEFELPGRHVTEIYGAEKLDGLLGIGRRGERALDWGHISVQGDFLITTREPHMFEGQRMGDLSSHSATSSRRLAVLDRYSGEVLWEHEAETGFRHNAIVSNEETLFVVDGLSEAVLDRLARRGKEPEKASTLMALDLESGRVRWSRSSNVFGRYLMYIAEHDILVEGGAYDIDQRRRGGVVEGEPAVVSARRGEDGELLWNGVELALPGVISGEKLISSYGRDRRAVSLLTGQRVEREQHLTGARSRWTYSRSGKGCDAVNASQYLILFRGGDASYHDLEYDSGQGHFRGFRSGCTSNLIPADGVLNALDYTRTCSCAYAHQTSLAMVHMPQDPSVHFWTGGAGADPDPKGHGLNFGAPGRRVDLEGDGLIWYAERGTEQRHPTAIRGGDSPAWVAASVRESGESIITTDLLDATYTVRLHFAELRGDMETGGRVFDVLIDGERVLEGFDIAREAGGVLRGVVREFEVEVEGGRMSIELIRSDGSERDPVVSGIELSTDVY